MRLSLTMSARSSRRASTPSRLERRFPPALRTRSFWSGRRGARDATALSLTESQVSSAQAAMSCGRARRWGGAWGGVVWSLKRWRAGCGSCREGGAAGGERGCVGACRGVTHADGGKGGLALSVREALTSTVFRALAATSSRPIRGTAFSPGSAVKPLLARSSLSRFARLAAFVKPLSTSTVSSFFAIFPCQRLSAVSSESQARLHMVDEECCGPALAGQLPESRFRVLRRQARGAKPKVLPKGLRVPNRSRSRCEMSVADDDNDVIVLSDGEPEGEGAAVQEEGSGGDEAERGAAGGEGQCTSFVPESEGGGDYAPPSGVNFSECVSDTIDGNYSRVGGGTKRARSEPEAAEADAPVSSAPCLSEEQQLVANVSPLPHTPVLLSCASVACFWLQDEQCNNLRVPCKTMPPLVSPRAVRFSTSATSS